jgi:hypothetical protein
MPFTAIAFGCLLLSQMSQATPPAVPVQQPAAPALALPSAEPNRLAEPTKPAEPVMRSLLRTGEPSEPAGTAPKAPADGSLASSATASAFAPAQAGTQPRLNPTKIVDQSLTLPSGSAIGGRPITLLAVLSTTGDRRRQFDLTHAYWRLAAAVAEYRFCFEENEQLGPVQAGGDDEAVELRLARASAAAALQEAEADAVAAQHELAGLMSPAAGPLSPASLPLPADRPHVGAYHTYFNELFGGGSAPGRTRLIDRAMPLRQAAIAAHTVALQASEDALAAALEARATGQNTLPPLLNRLDERRRQQQEFMASVCRYNHDIADYALTVAGPASSSESLVAMLIRTDREAIQPSTGTEPGRVVPASANEPAAQPTRAEPIPQEPTRAVRPRQVPSDPQLQSPPASAPASPPDSPPAAWTPAAPEGKSAPTLAPMHSLLRKNGDAPPPSTPPATPSTPATPPPPTPPPATNPTTYESRRLIAGGEPTPTEAASPAVYAALAHATDAGRVKQLTLALSWDQSLPAGTGQALGLAECLRSAAVRPAAVRSAAASDRLAVIGDYWVARQRAAQCQVLLEQGQWLDALVPLVLAHGAREAAAMLQLQASRLALRAAQIEANLALMESQFALAQRMGRDGDRLWPLPNSLPRADAGALNLEAPSVAAAESRALRRWRATLAPLGRGLQERAAAVVESDALRAAATLGYESGSRPLPEVLSAVRRQTVQTFAFLQTLTDYNQALAGSTLALLPPDTPADAVAAALIAEP